MRRKKKLPTTKHSLLLPHLLLPPLSLSLLPPLQPPSLLPPLQNQRQPLRSRLFP
jgi:hypothetical protein